MNRPNTNTKDMHPAVHLALREAQLQKKRKFLQNLSLKETLLLAPKQGSMPTISPASQRNQETCHLGKQVEGRPTVLYTTSTTPASNDTHVASTVQHVVTNAACNDLHRACCWWSWRCTFLGLWPTFQAALISYRLDDFDWPPHVQLWNIASQKVNQCLRMHEPFVCVYDSYSMNHCQSKHARKTQALPSLFKPTTRTKKLVWKSSYSHSFLVLSKAQLQKAGPSGIFKSSLESQLHHLTVLHSQCNDSEFNDTFPGLCQGGG